MSGAFKCTHMIREPLPRPTTPRPLIRIVSSRLESAHGGDKGGVIKQQTCRNAETQGPFVTHAGASLSHRKWREKN